jgi:CRP-like cAMP-binding protein
MMSMTIKEFFSSGRQKKYSSGELILSGESPAGVFYISSGFVKVYSISDEGEKYLHILYKSGELFPLIWAFKGLGRRVYYEAVSDTVACSVSKEEFLDLLQANKEAEREVLNQLVEQFNVYADRLDNLQYKSAKEKLIYRLLFLASRFGERHGNNIVIKAPITHELLAESINLTRETVSREIEKLEKQGLVGRQSGHIVITDVDKVERQFSEPVSLDLWGLHSKK